MSCPGMQERAAAVPCSLGEWPPYQVAGLRLEAWDSHRGGERPEEKRNKRKGNGEDSAVSSSKCLDLQHQSSIMVIETPGLLSDLEGIDYFVIGIGAELAAPSSQGARSQSPGGLSINLGSREETRDLLHKGNSVVGGDEATFRGVVLEEKDAQQVAQSDDKYLATPLASTSSSLSTTPTLAGPLESYLACPQSHEKQALSLSRDDDGEQGGPRDSRFGHLMERYLASEEDREFLEDYSGHMPSKDGNNDTAKAPILESETVPPSEDGPFASNSSMPLTTEPSIDSVAPIAGVLDGPIEVGYDRQSPDSGISDMQADELHHLL
ncbi:hypothetical protein LY78DRAFT_699586 [Colletotrichum sublineola]|nr:hypothetical protein LY78DRAFT_699586 [Colletotrichum sublineola]